MATREMTPEGVSDSSFAKSLGRLLGERSADIDTLARKVGAERRYLEALLDGDKEPSSGMIELIARALGVSASHFFEYRLATVTSALEWDPERLNHLFLESMTEAERTHVDDSSFDNKPLREAIRALLAVEEMTQAELAESIGLTPSEFSQILNSRVDAPADLPHAIAQAFGVPAECLLAYRLEVVTEWLHESPRELNALWEDMTHGIELAPYDHWPMRSLPDPRRVSLVELARSLIEIVKVEGPVLGARVYSLRLRGAGVSAETRELRSLLNRASFAAMQAGALIGVDERSDRTQKYLVLRVPGSPEVLMRARGDRSIPEIPLAEVCAVVESTRSYRVGDSVQDVQNEVLAAYGVDQPRLADVEHINHAINMKGGR